MENHTDFIDDGLRNWMVYLFTESNLSKMNSAKNTNLIRNLCGISFEEVYGRSTSGIDETIDEKQTGQITTFPEKVRF